MLVEEKQRNDFYHLHMESQKQVKPNSNSQNDSGVSNFILPLVIYEAILITLGIFFFMDFTNSNFASGGSQENCPVYLIYSDENEINETVQCGWVGFDLYMLSFGPAIFGFISSIILGIVLVTQRRNEIHETKKRIALAFIFALSAIMCILYFTYWKRAMYICIDTFSFSQSEAVLLCQSDTESETACQLYLIVYLILSAVAITWYRFSKVK